MNEQSLLEEVEVQEEVETTDAKPPPTIGFCGSVGRLVHLWQERPCAIEPIAVAHLLGMRGSGFRYCLGLRGSGRLCLPQPV